MVRNGSSSRTQLLPTRPRQLTSGCGGSFWPSSAPRIGPQGVQTSHPLDSKLWAACFEEHGLPKGSQQPEEPKPKEIPCEGSGWDPMVTVRAVIPEWPEHLKACVEEEGSHFE